MTSTPKDSLDFARYQREALTTDRTKQQGDLAFMVPLLGLVGEVGTLAVEHKKRLRDGDKHQLFQERITEDLGDILWYVANFASKSGLDLTEIARKNLEKVRARWALPSGTQIPLFDQKFKAKERIPRHFVVEFRVDGQRRLQLLRDGKRIGNALTDNNYLEDGYRFHDVFHFAYAAVLGWSPVTRGLLDCKRRSSPMTDEVEDGGRAAVLEEGIALLAYAHARAHNFLDGVTEVDHQILETIQRMSAHLEVRARTAAEWQEAILVGFRIWRELRKGNGGFVTVDLETRQLFYASAPAAKKATQSKPRRPKKGAKRNVGSVVKTRRQASRLPNAANDR